VILNKLARTSGPEDLPFVTGGGGSTGVGDAIFDRDRAWFPKSQIHQGLVAWP
jgi:hypothetical protein